MTTEAIVSHNRNLDSHMTTEAIVSHNRTLDSHMTTEAIVSHNRTLGSHMIINAHLHIVQIKECDRIVRQWRHSGSQCGRQVVLPT